MNNRNDIFNITSYIISLTIYIFATYIIYNLFYKLSLFYLLITVPLFFLFGFLTLNNIAKLLITLIKITFGSKDNTEVSNFTDLAIKFSNRVTKYSLIAIFITLLFSVMGLDIYICILEEKYVLISLSIVVWIFMYYFLFKTIINVIKKNVKA